jgi:hypothetical protein
MKSEQLKNLVEAGDYKPDPALVAQAMLRRRAVRVLLTAASFTSAGQTQPAPATSRRAA